MWIEHALPSSITECEAQDNCFAAKKKQNIKELLNNIHCIPFDRNLLFGLQFHSFLSSLNARWPVSVQTSPQTILWNGPVYRLIYMYRQGYSLQMPLQIRLKTRLKNCLQNHPTLLIYRPVYLSVYRPLYKPLYKPLYRSDYTCTCQTIGKSTKQFHRPVKGPISRPVHRPIYTPVYRPFYSQTNLQTTGIL